MTQATRPLIRRRDFIAMSGGILLWPARNILADHHVVSADPLVLESDLRSLPDGYTPLEDFYVRDHYAVPTKNAAVVRIEGEVDAPRDISEQDLNSFPQREIGAVLECAGNGTKSTGLVSDGLWRGWPLKSALSLARPKATASYLHLFGRDGFSRSVTLDQANDTGLLATGLNGHPLPPRHGGPWRALFPGWYGMDSIKWLEKVVLASSPLPPAGNTYLQLREDGSGAVDRQFLPRILVKSVILHPAEGDVLRRGKIQIRGLAWSGSGKIDSVEVSAGGKPGWRLAAFKQPTSSYDWIAWSATLEIGLAGAISLISKATDTSGNTQPETRDPNRVDQYAYNVCDRIRCVVI